MPKPVDQHPDRALTTTPAALVGLWITLTIIAATYLCWVGVRVSHWAGRGSVVVLVIVVAVSTTTLLLEASRAAQWRSVYP